MTKSKRKPVTPPDPYPITFETFRNLAGYDERQMQRPDPSCFNGIVSVVKYRVTIERVEEPVEVIHARLRTLWRATDNHHHVDPLRQAAAQYGLELDRAEFGADVVRVMR